MTRTKTRTWNRINSDQCEEPICHFNMTSTHPKREEWLAFRCSEHSTWIFFVKPLSFALVLAKRRDQSRNRVGSPIVCQMKEFIVSVLFWSIGDDAPRSSLCPSSYVSFLEGKKILPNKYTCMRYSWMCRKEDIAQIIRGEINRYLAFCLSLSPVFLRRRRYVNWHAYLFKCCCYLPSCINRWHQQCTYLNESID